MRLHRRAYALSALVLATGCLRHREPPPPPEPDAGIDAWVGTPIGPEGGTVEGAGARVIVPAGAVSGPTSIALTPSSEPGPRDLTLIGDVIAITPHGARFATPVTLELPLPPEYAYVQVWTKENDPFAPWERLDAHIEDGIATVAVDHFSFFALIDPGLTWELVTAPPTDESFRDLEWHRDMLYALTDQTVLRSADGVTWLEMADGLPRTDGTLGLNDLASTDLGLLLATTRGVFRFDGASWRDLSAGIPDNGAGAPARVDRISTLVSVNTFLVGAALVGTEYHQFVRWWSNGSSQWVPLADITGPRGSQLIEQVPHCLAINSSGVPGFTCVTVPEGTVSRAELGPTISAPFVFAVRDISYYRQVWLGTEQDIFRADDNYPVTGPYTHLGIASGWLVQVRDFLERPYGEVLVAASEPPGVFVTHDGESFVSVSDGLPTSFSEGVYRLTSLRSVVYAMTEQGIYRGRASRLTCGLPGDVCAGDGDCCDGTCSGGVCTSDACGADGASCRLSAGCCSAYCADGACRLRDPDRCGTAGDACASGGDCCRGDCVSGQCVDLTHCRCDPAGSCGAADGCGGTCTGACPSGTECLETAHGGDFCGVPCSDWHDCRRVAPNDSTYCCVEYDGVGACAGTGTSCDTECAPEGASCGAIVGLGCCDPDPADNQRPICCPPDLTGYANTCSCTETVLP